ncbi:Transmembrane domain-containing protein [Cedratvirus Zaza IHUMI]|uniref:Transmembrane domain-containing protein n=1 Tax=Cedratvirus Zaza IHUMI TaxID=2126979 RepID=A0A2R8FFK6_9VIRU|nr:Transmembrane domain-containing protein [Cedratvirus Zaza IHUMI]
MDDCVRQEYAISIILTGLITYVIVFFSLYFSRNSLLYYQYEGETLYLPVSSSLIWQISLFVAVVAAFAAAVAFF